MRNNPRITLPTRAAIRANSPTSRAVMARPARARRSAIATVLDSVQIQGVTEEYVEFSSFDAERGRLVAPSEVERRRPVVAGRLGRRRKAVRRVNPLDKIIKINGVHFRVVGVSAKKGSFFGNSFDSSASSRSARIAEDLRRASPACR